MFSSKSAVSKTDITRGYAKRPTITDYLPWRDYNDKYQVFLLEDQQSLRVCLSIKPVACEARPLEKMEAIQQAIAEALKNAIPLEKINPWIVQVFVQRENKLDATFDAIKAAVKQSDTPALTEAHLSTIKEHLDYITQPGGVFCDQAVYFGRIEQWFHLFFNEASSCENSVY